MNAKEINTKISLYKTKTLLLFCLALTLHCIKVEYLSTDPKNPTSFLTSFLLSQIEDNGSNGRSFVSMPTGLLKTGQITVYETGDDGTYQKGIERSFTVGGTTGLLWQRCSAGQNSDATCSGMATPYTWEDANSYCSSLILAGKTWRLPTVNELANLVDYGKSTAPSIDTTGFPLTRSRNYWSSSTYAQDTSLAWGVYFYNGVVYILYKTDNNYVRCVTGP